MKLDTWTHVAAVQPLQSSEETEILQLRVNILSSLLTTLCQQPPLILFLAHSSGTLLSPLLLELIFLKVQHVVHSDNFLFTMAAIIAFLSAHTSLIFSLLSVIKKAFLSTEL